MSKTFKENQLVVYKNGDKFEVGKIKTLKEHGAFIWYHSGETAALTNYEDIHPIINEHCILKTNLGGNQNA